MTKNKLVDPFDTDEQISDALSSFDVKPPKPQAKKSQLTAADRTATEQGFTARRRTKKRRLRRSDNFITGRSETITMKGKQEDKSRLDAICDSQGWVKGQALAYALDALEQFISDPESTFWTERNFHGVD